jgi:hypothetical protein
MSIASVWLAVGRHAVLLGAAALIFSATQPATAAIYSDNFNDGNDGGWTHLTNVVGSTGQTLDASTGAYHLIAPPNSEAGTASYYGFAGSYLGPVGSNVKVSADVVDFGHYDDDGDDADNDGFQDGVVPPTPATPAIKAFAGFFGVATRLHGATVDANSNLVPGDIDGPPIDPADPVDPLEDRIKLHGYTYHYEPFANGGLGEMVLGLQYAGGSKDIGSQMVSLDVNKDYRFTLTVIGNELRGQVFELDAFGAINPVGPYDGGAIGDRTRNLDTEPVGDLDHDSDEGFVTSDIPFVPYTSGYSGVLTVGNVLIPPPYGNDGEVTYDNFVLQTSDPADFDNDFDVDGADLATWKSAFGATAAGDADGDGDSDGADFLAWQRQYTGALPSVAALAAAPEPALSTFALPLILAAASRLRRTHR